MSAFHSRPVLLSGVQPSNRLTLGNYLGALSHWVRLQEDYDCIFFAGDLHTITVRQNPASFRAQVLHTIATFLAAGILPERSLLFLQSQVPAHAQLSWILECHAHIGELSRMTQFKDKSAKQGDLISAGLLTYPALMAADILLYRAERVPVGQDQLQHLEMTRDIAKRMNHLYGEDLLILPQALSPPTGARIMSLQNPQQKMSKSDPDPFSTIFLDDADDLIAKKFRRALTDSGSSVQLGALSPGVANLVEIQAAITHRTRSQIEDQVRAQSYGRLKTNTADCVIECISPMRARMKEYLGDPVYLEGLLEQGRLRASTRAQLTLNRVLDALGFVT